MFYKMIERARDRWYGADSCSVSDLITYIEKKGQMRDAQIEAIKTYLYLKLACDCQSLFALFSRGYFNTLNLDVLEISKALRLYLMEHPAAAALYEYATMTNEEGVQVSAKLEKQIKLDPDSVDYSEFFRKAFYGVSYTDYLFSLPMGAGKTYLMAAFIYLDLYFARMEPNNPAFAHNFIVFAPSGLKSSVVPSLRTIQKFDPVWVLPEPTASELKRQISFEILDQGKTASKSNKTKNPNVQKIASHQPLSELFGLVAVTNAEKVILDRIQEKNGQVSLFEDSEDDKDRQANELRNLIGKLPGLSIFIDEVHHAVSDEIKLRAVVNHWAQNQTVNSVIGFSGTPYLEKAEKIPVTDKLSVSTAEITNIVYYYPLIDGVGNFLKRPVVKISNVADSSRIIDAGVRSFLDSYKETVYDGGLVAKLGIYCGSIEKLEEVVYPIVSRIAAEYGLDPSCILKFYRESTSKDKSKKKYIAPTDSQMQFDTLDTPVSRIRIILLVQIGKEGWDCKSLTGIILSQEGDCPKTMVLQTSCRCLRQVTKGSPETALIYLNESNADKLNSQLQQMHHISLRDLEQAERKEFTLNRYNRTKYLKLPKIDFYQLRVNYETKKLETANPEEQIPYVLDSAGIKASIVKTTDFSMDMKNIQIDDEDHGDCPATFSSWLRDIIKGSFGTLTMAELKPHETLLQQQYEQITYVRDGVRYYSSKFDQNQVKANIRKAFCDKRTFTTREELIPEQSSLLNISNFSCEVKTPTPDDYYPSQDKVEQIIQADMGKLKAPKDLQDLIEKVEALGLSDTVASLKEKFSAHPQKDRSFHYLPYRTDSSFEQSFLRDVLALTEVEQLDLEVYYNGDRAMTEFKIKCYQSTGSGWRYIGMYTPDFLILKRKDGEIHKAIIVETKGRIYANDPTFKEKRTFMETAFISQNNKAFDYDRFDYLYLEDSFPEADRIRMTHDKICAFFKE